MHINDAQAFECSNIDNTHKLPIFYFPSNGSSNDPNDLDFSKLQQLVGNTTNVGKYIVIFGYVNNNSERSNFASECIISNNNFFATWTNNDQTKIKIKTSNGEYQNTKNVESIFKRIAAFDNDFVPTDYEKTKENFSKTDDSNLQNSLLTTVKKI